MWLLDCEVANIFDSYCFFSTDSGMTSKLPKGNSLEDDEIIEVYFFFKNQ